MTPAQTGALAGAGPEEWRAVPGFPNYAVSDRGRVKRMTTRTSGVAGTILSAAKTRWGHKYVGLSRPGGTCGLWVHRLVLTAFVGPCPPGLECRHMNGDATDNRIGNLTWGTHMQNMRDRNRHGTAPIGEKSGTAKFTNREVARIKRRLLNGELQKHIAVEFGVHKTTIQAMASGRNWPSIKAAP